MIIYLLHFDKLVLGKQHYLGCTSNLDNRLKEHNTGSIYSSILCKEAFKNNISFILVKTWENDWNLEKRLKRNGHLNRYCNICIKSPDPLLSAG